MGKLLGDVCLCVSMCAYVCEDARMSKFQYFWELSLKLWLSE